MKKYAYFGGMTKAHTKWLNKLAQAGWRLVRIGKLSYEFDQCKPGEYQYCIEYVGHMSLSESQAYKHFLEDLGYRVWYKNINLQWSTGKVQYRPWANKGGRIATSSTTIDKELLIVEKINDGSPFVLHTTLEDRIRIARQHRDPWLIMMLLFFGAGLLLNSPAFYIVTAISFIPGLIYHLELSALKKDARISEE